jgi:ribosomal protein L20A (L18A)
MQGPCKIAEFNNSSDRTSGTPTHCYLHNYQREINHKNRETQKIYLYTNFASRKKIPIGNVKTNL